MCFTVLHAVFSHISAIRANSHETIIFRETVKERARTNKTLFRWRAKKPINHTVAQVVTRIIKLVIVGLVLQPGLISSKGLQRHNTRNYLLELTKDSKPLLSVSKSQSIRLLGKQKPHRFYICKVKKNTELCRQINQR